MDDMVPNRKVDRLFGKRFWLIFAGALLLRLLLLSQTTWLPWSDTRDYHDLARSLVERGEYAQIYDDENEAFQGMTLRAYRMPGYPFILAGIYGSLGWNTAYAYAVNLIFELISLIGLTYLVHKLLGRRAALIAAGLFAIHVLWVPALMTESIFTCLILTLLILVIEDWSERPWRFGAIFGFVLLIAFFIRPIAIAFIPVAGLKLIEMGLFRWRTILTGVLLIAPLTAGLVAWSARNQRVLDEFVLTSTNLGPHNAYNVGLDKPALILAMRAEGKNEAEINDALVGLIVERLRAEPIEAAELYVARIIQLFSLRKVFEIQFIQGDFPVDGEVMLSGWPSQLYRALFFQYYLIYPLALIGAYWTIVTRRLPWPFWAAIFSFLFLHGVVSYGNIRFFAPLYPAALVLAVFAIDQIGSIWMKESAEV